MAMHATLRITRDALTAVSSFLTAKLGLLNKRCAAICTQDRPPILPMERLRLP